MALFHDAVFPLKFSVPREKIGKDFKLGENGKVAPEYLWKGNLSLKRFFIQNIFSYKLKGRKYAGDSWAFCSSFVLNH